MYEGEEIILKPLDSFSIEAVKPFQKQSRKNQKIRETICFLKVLITLIMMILLEKRIPRDENFFHPDLSLSNIPATSYKYCDSEDENLELQFFHETFPSVIKQSLDDSFFVTSFFKLKYTTKLNEFF